jgi:hypothetical protein
MTKKHSKKKNIRVLNMSTVSAHLRFSGRLFQRPGALELKVSSPCLLVLVFGKVKRPVPEDLRDLLGT